MSEQLDILNESISDTSISKNTHKELCFAAEKWLKKMNCGVVFRDCFRALTGNGEQPDAIGFRQNVSILVEVKISRSDFLADAKKRFRIESSKGMGDWRFYLCLPDVIRIDDLPHGWGLLYFDGKRVKAIHGVPQNTRWDSKPFGACKRSEIDMLYSALRRMVIRGHFDSIYEKL